MRPSRLAVLVAALALTLAGCSEAVQEAAERSPDPVVAAAGRTADAESARVGLTLAPPDAAPLVTGEGMFDLADGDAGHLVMELPGAGGAPQTMEVRVVDGEAYLRTPATAAQHPQAPWVHLDAAAAPGDGGDPVQGLATQNPAEIVGLLESATDVTEAGTTSLRGAEVTLWRGSLDLTALAQDDAATQQLRSLGTEQVPAEAAIDEEGRLRRLALTLDVAAVAGATGTSLPPGTPQQITMSVELFDFGVTVDVEAPAADRVTEAAAMAPAA